MLPRALFTDRFRYKAEYVASTARVSTGNVTLSAPIGTVTRAGTEAAAGDALSSITTTPP
jgi:hypothetical protein